jgi:dihydroflavonol-4-reductase
MRGGPYLLVPMTTLLTGGAGLVGSHVARLLVERGDDVRLTVRANTRLANLEGLEAERLVVDIHDRTALRRALRGVERVFHAAGLANLRATPAELWTANVEGTRIVLEEALRAGVDQVVMTSSVAAVGPAKRGSTADEKQPFPRGTDAIAYVRSKREAEVQALRIAALGLPVVIVCPAHVFGRGDVNHSSTEVVRRFLRREIPAYVDGALNIVDAEDVARGHLLADEKGRPGERYILGNRNFTLDRLFADLGRLSGVEPPAVKLPLPAAIALARALEAMPGRPPITVTEVRAASQWWAFRSNKARRELGWKPSHHEDTLQTTIDWYREREAHSLRTPGTRQPLALRAVGFAVKQADGVVGRLVP